MFEVVPPVHIKAPERDLWLIVLSKPTEVARELVQALQVWFGKGRKLWFTGLDIEKDSAIGRAIRMDIAQNGENVEVTPNPIFTSNSYFTLLQCAKNGIGVANLYQYMVDDELERGNLIELLPDWRQSSRDRYAVYQQRRDSSLKLDLFIKFLMSLFYN